MRLMSIPAGLFDVAFAAADKDDSGTIDQEELEKLVHVRGMPSTNVLNSGTGKNINISICGRTRHEIVDILIKMHVP